MLENKKVLITGATGSLGRALIKRLYKEDKCKEIIVFSRDETKQGKLRKQYPDLSYVLGDVSRLSDLELAFRGVDVVYHFAAYKQVPSAQNNVLATLETNINGSRYVARAAIMNDVEQVVASSTDKACEPVNMYGVSKRAMENIFQDANKHGPTTFHLARYGNVVCSNASVIPLFKEQRDKGGPITITHDEMTRFWITLDTAVDLVNHALLSDPGTIVVPKAGAMSIYALAKMFATGGLEIKEIGIRAGEKVHEYMVAEAESFHTMETEDLFYIYPPTSDYVSSSAPFVYTSKDAPAISPTEMLRMIEQYEEDYA